MTERRFFLDQHGCAKNQVDGELLISRLEGMGMVRTDNASHADLIIINSCGFIESAKQESLDAVLHARTAYPHAKILLAGCLAERYADVFAAELPEADGLFGNGDLTQIDGAVRALFAGERPVVRPPQQEVCCGNRDVLLSFAGSAYVKITEGCDNRCSFCAIPLIRGSLRSRSADSILAEIEGLLARGVREINLIGQDLAAYGCGAHDDVFGRGTNGHDVLYRQLRRPLLKAGNCFGDGFSPLTELLGRISALPGDFWIRLLYIHPDHFCPDMLDCLKKDRRILPYFDIPFQTGDDALVAAMNRKGSAADYVDLVRHIRAVFPDACIRTTFLTGFPGEDGAAATHTERFLQDIQSDWSGCFAYSREEDTPASRMKGRVPKEQALHRQERLRVAQEAITAERLRKRCGAVYTVLVEEIIENKDGSDEGLAIGRAWFQAPEVDGNVVIRYDRSDAAAVAAITPGAFVPVRAMAASAVDIDGEYCG